MTDGEKKLLDRTNKLIEEMADFLVAHEETSVPIGGGYPPEQREAFVAGITREYQALQTAYATRFSGRVLAIVDAFGAMGIKPRGTMDPTMMFQHPTNPMGVREVITELGFLVETLQLRP